MLNPAGILGGGILPGLQWREQWHPSTGICHQVREGVKKRTPTTFAYIRMWEWGVQSCTQEVLHGFTFDVMNTEERVLKYCHKVEILPHPVFSGCPCKHLYIQDNVHRRTT